MHRARRVPELGNRCIDAFRLEGKTTQTLLCLCESDFCFKKQNKKNNTLLFTNQTGISGRLGGLKLDGQKQERGK